MGALSSIKFEGYTAEELLALPVGDFDAHVFADDALVIEIGSCKLLGKFSTNRSRLVLELAQIDGGGEGVLPALASLANKVASARGLTEVEWQVHAVHCATPNLKLRRVLERRGFNVCELPGIGEVYHQVTNLGQPRNTTNASS